jgi:hypothetical protein
MAAVVVDIDTTPLIRETTVDVAVEARPMKVEQA